MILKKEKVILLLKQKKNRYGAILKFFEINQNKFIIVKYYKEINKKNFLKKLSNDEANEALKRYFYEIFKFMIVLNEYEIIELDGIQKCFMFEFDEFSIISKCVDLEDID